MGYSNNDYLKKATVSNKMRNIELIEDYITKRIDDNQTIKRLLMYNTKTPLLNDGVSYDKTQANLISQPNINNSLIDENIICCLFNPEIENVVDNKIFIGITDGMYNRKNMGVVDCYVNILVSQEYNQIVDGKRIWGISQEVVNMFDGIMIDESDIDYHKELGNIKFNLDNFGKMRLSKTNKLLWLKLKFSIEVSGWRI